MDQGPESTVFDPAGRTARTGELITQLLAVVAELEQMHPGRKFPLDGHLVGSLGEAAAEALFELTLVTASSAGHDAVTAQGRKVEIKATFGSDGVAVRPTSSLHEDAALIVLRLSKMPATPHEVVYNGPMAHALAAASTMKSNGQATMRLSRLRQLNRDVSDEQRVPRRPS
ncbi:MAG: hypothetical protein QM779_04140 [Propionicimonas sp.]|uniref:DUF6998 domain-containing protein n=1 Tax=Propionicimonas sp. TaxID=1955623 RepID=UPI003D10661F